MSKTPSNFRLRVVMLFCGLLLLSQTVFFLLYDRFNTENAHRGVLANLTTTTRVFERVLNDRFMQLTEVVQLLASDYGFRSAVASTDQKTVQSMMENHARRIGADLISVFDPDGTITSTYPPTPAADLTQAFKLVLSAPDLEQRMGDKMLTMIILGGKLYQIVIVPIKAPQLVSYAAVGFVLTPDFARDVQKMTDAEISFVAEDRGKLDVLVSTNISKLETPDFVHKLEEHKDSRNFFSIRSSDGEYITYSMPLFDLGAQKFYAVMQTSFSKGLAPYVGYRPLLFLIALIFLAVSGIVSVIVSRQVTRPMMMLVENLMSAAKNPERPDIKEMKKLPKDEIGVALRITNDLIKQNASNLKRLRSAAEDKIHKLAYYDNLTGLPNRTYFLEKLDDAIRHKVVEEDRRIAVFSVDLDHFKDINDTMGHEFGDKLLEAIGRRLVKAMPEDAIISRASADEFTILVVLKPEYPESQILIERIFAIMAEPVSILQERFQVRVSIGVSHCPDDTMEARQLLKNADIALNRAKEEGRDTVRFYSQDFDLAVQQRFQLLRDLREALDGNQLMLHYHPQFDLKTGQLIGAEVLLRWFLPDNSKDGGYYVSPAEFIPVAEQSGLIVPIGEWVLRTACAQVMAWQQLGIPPFRIAVNISGVQFHKAQLVALVEDVLKESRLDPQLLELEVTESVFMENMQVAIDILNQLHRLGVELAIDDFGTGYSSLSYLRQFPIDRLKIDQSFIRNALINPDDRMITKTIINLGHSLNLKVIAEGVETNDHETFLKEEGCDEVQGFKYTKPIPAEKFQEYIINYTREWAKKHRPSVVEDKKA